MKDIVIIGAGSFGKEVAQMISDINADKKEWNLLGFVDETAEKIGTVIDEYPVLGSFDWFEKKKGSGLYTVCAIGNPRDKYTLIKKAEAFHVGFANLIHPNAKISKYVQMGTGNIICYHSFISVHTKFGNHVSINPNCGIGHDSSVDDYSVLYWDVTLSGNVKIGVGCELGSKSVVIPWKSVGNWSILGAGAVVVKDIPENCTAVGIPAKPIKFKPNERIDKNEQ